MGNRWMEPLGAPSVMLSQDIHVTQRATYLGSRDCRTEREEGLSYKGGTRRREGGLQGVATILLNYRFFPDFQIRQGITPSNRCNAVTSEIQSDPVPANTRVHAAAELVPLHPAPSYTAIPHLAIMLIELSPKARLTRINLSAH